LTLLAILLLASACGSDSNNDPDPITLRYANLNLGYGLNDEVERQMLQAFMDDHSHITVVIDEGHTAPWLDSLEAAAYHGNLPDVFMVDDLGGAMVAGLLLDITNLAQNDDDFFDMPGIVQETVMQSGAVYAIPFAQHMHGYFVNQSLFSDIGFDVPSFGITAGEFLGAVHAVTDPVRMIMGLNQSHSFVDWYPSAINPGLVFFAYDGAAFNLNGPEMLEAVRIATELHAMGYTLSGLAHEDRQEHFQAGYELGAFRDEQLAFFYGGSWHLERMINQAAFDWDFIGVPGGRAVVTLEIIGVSATTEHPEEAYLLASWMGHSVEGNLRRLELYKELEMVPTILPVTQNSSVLDALWEIIPSQGLISAYSAMDRALIDGLRVMPGYMQARFAASTDVEIHGTAYTNASIDALLRYTIYGYVNFLEHSENAEAIALQQLQDAQAALGR